MHRIQNAKCSTCYYWERDSGENAVQGTCRAHPPRFTGKFHKGEPEVAYVRLDEGNVCGEWRSIDVLFPPK